MCVSARANDVPCARACARCECIACVWDLMLRAVCAHVCACVCVRGCACAHAGVDVRVRGQSRVDTQACSNARVGMQRACVIVFNREYTALRFCAVPVDSC